MYISHSRFVYLFYVHVISNTSRSYYSIITKKINNTLHIVKIMVKHLRKITEFKVLKLVHFYMKIDILKLKKLQFLGDEVPQTP